MFVQILLLAQAAGYLQLGNISLDGSKIHADASKSKAVGYKRLVAIERYLQEQVTELLALAAQADKQPPPEGMNLGDEIARREQWHKDQYNFTDPDSAIMNNARDKGVDQYYDVQVVVDKRLP